MLLPPVDQNLQTSVMLSGLRELQKAILSPCKNKKLNEIFSDQFKQNVV
jgi:hypothetical protein